MSGLNKIMIIGRLGMDPVCRQINTGLVANLRIATSETWKDKATGAKKDKTEWHSVVLYGRLAEIAQQYFKKGSNVYIEGSIRTRKWQDKSGADRYTTEIIGAAVQMLDSRASNASPEYVPPPAHDYDLPAMDEDEIPF